MLSLQNKIMKCVIHFQFISDISSRGLYTDGSAFIASHPIPAQQINGGRPLEAATAADRVTLLVTHQVSVH